LLIEFQIKLADLADLPIFAFSINSKSSFSWINQSEMTVSYFIFAFNFNHRLN